MTPNVSQDNPPHDRDRLISAISNGVSTIDGVMSPVTKRLLKRFNAKGIDMTSWWAMTPPNWMCAGCGRSKEHIARLNQNGDLMCRLVEHHDHACDLLARKFSDISASLQRVVADKTAEHFAKRSATMISAYENAILCDDCNGADAKAKKIVGADKFFSFSPGEIRRFVVVTSNKGHGIDEKCAAEIWATNRPAFETRIKIATRIATIAASNEHWFQEGEVGNNPDLVRRHFSAVTAHYRALNIVSDLCGKKSTITKTDTAAWRTTVFPTAKIKPTAGQIDHVARVSHDKAWHLVSDDWTCPACHRTKAHTVRQNKDGGWGISLQSVTYRAASGDSRGIKAILCGDCSWTAQRLGMEAAAQVGLIQPRYSALVEVTDVATVILPRAHSRHLYEENEVIKVVTAIVDRLYEAIDDDFPDD